MFAATTTPHVHRKHVPKPFNHNSNCQLEYLDLSATDDVKTVHR